MDDVKRIYLDEDTPINDWIDINKNLIMNEIYNNIFTFAESESDELIIMEIVQKTARRKKRRRGGYIDSNHIDVLLLREELNETLNVLLDYMESSEEYEKCAEIYKLIQKVNN